MSRAPFAYIVPPDEPDADASTAWLARVAETPIVKHADGKLTQLAVFNSPWDAWSAIPLALWKPDDYNTDRNGRRTRNIMRPDSDCRRGFDSWLELRTGMATNTPAPSVRQAFANVLREHADPGAVAAQCQELTRRARPVWSDEGDEPDTDRVNARAEDWGLSIRRGASLPTVRLGFNTYATWRYQNLSHYQAAAAIAYMAATAGAELGFGVEVWIINAAEHDKRFPWIQAQGTAYRLCRADEPLDVDAFAAASTVAGHKMLTWATLCVMHDYYRSQELVWTGHRNNRAHTGLLARTLGLDLVIDDPGSGGTLAEITGGLLLRGMDAARDRARIQREDPAPMLD